MYDEVDGQIKIIDFGTSVEYDKREDKLSERHGAPYYIAPEVLN